MVNVHTFQFTIAAPLLCSGDGGKKLKPDVDRKDELEETGLR